MRNTRYRFLVLLSSLLMLTGCSRRDILDDYPVSGVGSSGDFLSEERRRQESR